MPNLSFLCLKMVEIEIFILLSWQLIYPSNHTQKSGFSLGRLHMGDLSPHMGGPMGVTSGGGT